GPPMQPLVPQSAEMMKPAITAVKMPASGLTPEAVAKAIVSGSATMPTVMPATRSAKKSFDEYPFSVSTNFGRNENEMFILKIQKTADKIVSVFWDVATNGAEFNSEIHFFSRRDRVNILWTNQLDNVESPPVGKPTQ